MGRQVIPNRTHSSRRMHIAMLDENSLILFFLFFFTNSFAGIAPGGRPVLSFVVGDDIEVINKHDPEWWEVR